RRTARVEMGQRFVTGCYRRGCARFFCHLGRYHKHIPMRPARLLLLALGSAAALALPRAFAQGLPDLGGSGETALSPQVERRLGESIMRDIRLRESTYVDDPETAEYLGELGSRLAAATSGARHGF